MSFTQRTGVLDVGSGVFDDDLRTCADCGDEMEDDHPTVNEPAPEYGRNACLLVHAWCAVRNGYRLRWPS